jgi:hypothetical protein
MSSYDKGFGGAGPPQRGQRHRQEATAHGVAVTPANPHREFGEHIPGDAPHGMARTPARPPRPWADYAGRAGMWSAAVGLAGGLASLVAWGNWYAVFVLPILLGVTGAITFWLLAMVADTVRGVR